MFPLFAFAETYILPSGLEIKIEEDSAYKKIWEWFVLPSGFKYLAERVVPTAHAYGLTLRGQIVQHATTLALEKGIPIARLLKIIACESNFNPKAYNPKDVDGRPKYGLMQFDSRSFSGKDIWDWHEQLEAATVLIAKDGFGRWPTCSK